MATTNHVKGWTGVLMTEDCAMRDQYWNDLLSPIDDRIVERRCIAILVSEFHVSPMLQKQLDRLRHRASSLDLTGGGPQISLRGQRHALLSGGAGLIEGRRSLAPRH